MAGILLLLLIFSLFIPLMLTQSGTYRGNNDSKRTSKRQDHRIKVSELMIISDDSSLPHCWTMDGWINDSAVGRLTPSRPADSPTPSK